VLLQAEELKYAPEHDCYVLSGMDKNPCVNRTTCLYACFSVPVCSDLGSNGWSFIDTLEDYNASVYNADQLLSAALASGSALSQAPSYAAAQAALDDMAALNRAETAVIFQPLITSYGFCQPPEYGMPLQAGATRELLDYLDADCAEGQAGRIASESLHAAALLAPPPQSGTAGISGPTAPPANASNLAGTQGLADATVQEAANATGTQAAGTAPSSSGLMAAFVLLLACGFALGRIAAGRMH
jgi:hypothetical protein